MLREEDCHINSGYNDDSDFVKNWGGGGGYHNYFRGDGGGTVGRLFSTVLNHNAVGVALDPFKIGDNELFVANGGFINSDGVVVAVDSSSVAVMVVVMGSLSVMGLVVTAVGSSLVSPHPTVELARQFFLLPCGAVHL